MNRRDFLIGGSSIIGTTILTSLSGCSKSQFEDKNINIQTSSLNKLKLKLATSWPKSFPIMGDAVLQFAEKLKIVSSGSIDIQVFGKDELVPALAVFDSASIGAIDIFHSGPYYWKGKSLAISIFGGVPFGMTSDEGLSWFKYGGGMDLWREIYDRYNLYPLLGGNTGPQMGGWFKKEIKNIADLKGLKMRIPGLPGELFSRLGVNPILLSAGDIFTALERGTIDATEWVGPALDIKMGFHKVANYYYSGWTEPGSILELTFNKNSWAKLSNEQKLMVELVANDINNNMILEFHSENSKALALLREDKNIKIGDFPADVTNLARNESKKLMNEFSAQNSEFAKVWKSYSSFQKLNSGWSDLSMKSYLNSRG